MVAETRDPCLEYVTLGEVASMLDENVAAPFVVLVPRRLEFHRPMVGRRLEGGRGDGPYGDGPYPDATTPKICKRRPAVGDQLVWDQVKD